MGGAWNTDREQRLLERLGALHRADQPASLRRAALLRQLQRQPAIAATEPVESRPATRWGTVALCAAAAGVLIVAGVLGLERRTPATASTPAATATSRAATSATATERPCRVAPGSDGRLWSGASSTPDLLRTEGRFGRFMHQWPDVTAKREATAGRDVAAVGIAPATVTRVPLADGRLHHALTIAGPRVSGWGTKLGAGLRVRLGPGSDEVHFDCYDASRYGGIEFAARGKGVVFVLLQTRESVPKALGGTCEERCWLTSSHAVALTESVSEYRLTWDRFSVPHSRAESQLMMVEFFVQPQPDPYEVAVTEVAFMP